MRWPWKKKSSRTRQPPESVCEPDAPPSITAADAPMADDAPSPLEGLTPRERDVFEGMIRGLKLREIAEELGIQYSTVNTHQKSVYKKLGVNSRAECILRYGRPGKER